jgi:hypothetical protein
MIFAPRMTVIQVQGSQLSVPAGKRRAEVQPYILLGQADVPYARRSNVTGVLASPVMVFWNIEKR